MNKRWAAAVWGTLGVLAVILLWEAYKFLGPADGVTIGAIEGETGSGVMILPRTHDRAMPHVWEMVARLFQSTSGGDTPPLFVTVITAAITTLGIAAVGWLIGVVVGTALGLVMQRWRLIEWGLLPWIVVSQTVPLIAFAPVVNSIGLQIDRGGTPWPQWLSVAVIASYLAFFPVAVGVLRGLEAPDRIHLDLMHSYAAGYLAHTPATASSRSRAVPAARPSPGRRERGGGCRCRRGLDRDARGHRAHAHPTCGPGLQRPGSTVGSDVWLDRPGTRRSGFRRPHRRGPQELPQRRSRGMTHDTLAVQARGVGKVFPAKAGEVIALTGVDLEVAAGEFVSLIGPSGCGKSTLLRLIADLDEASSGDLTIFGKPARQARIDQDYGVAFQQAGLLPWRTVGANIALPLELHKVGKAERDARVRELVELVGLTDFVDRYPEQLSGGMQQRVAIARALASRPRPAPDGRALRGARRDDPRVPAVRARSDRRRDRRRSRVRYSFPSPRRCSSLTVLW